MKKQTSRALVSSCAAVFFLAALVTGNSQTLVHRYSFNDPAFNPTFSDSVGGANWTGTNVGSAYVDGSQLQLDGFTAWAILPSGIVSSYSQVTIEFWATFYPSNPVWTRVFAFGDQNNGAERTGVDYCHYAGGNWQNLNCNGVYINNPSGLNGQTNVHVTCVVNPVANKMYYYNSSKVTSGAVFNNGSGGTLSPLSAVNDTICLLGKSLFDQDQPLAGSIDEFRIYSGVLPSSQIALNDISGPDNIVTNPGPVQALHFSSPVGTLLVNQLSQQILTADFTNLVGVDMVAYGGVTYASLNTSVVTIDTNGLVKGVAPGTTKVTASFGGLFATNTLTVIALPATLTHRYSFNGTDANDSVGGANGTFYGNATNSAGKLVLDGSFGTYVDLPAAAINIATNSAVTFEAWVDFGPGATWAYLFGFGNTNGANGDRQIACVPRAEPGGYHHWGITENGGRTTGWAHGWSNMTAHITCVVDPPTGTLSIYRDGLLEFAEYDAFLPMSYFPTNYGFLGRSFYSADPYLTANIDEFRIYSGALTPAQVALTQAEGPNATSIDVGALTSITVPPTNYPSYSTLVPPLVLANYANVQNVNLLSTLTAAGNPNLGGPQPLVVTSSDSSIISVNSQNMLTTHRPGTVTLSASFQGKSGSSTVTVKNQAVLTHRYSFNVDNDASDSVGGANGTLQGNATVSGGQLQLTNAVDADYLDLPPGLLEGYDSVTIDLWANLGAAQHWSRIWEFTDKDADNLNVQNEFYFATGWDGTPDANFYNAAFPWGGNLFVNGPLQNGLWHITCLYGNGSMSVYTNGVFEGATANLIAPASSAGTASSTIGHSPFPDPGILGSIDEIRIYKGLLAPDEILGEDVIGPNTLLSSTASLKATRSGGNVVLSWPVAAAGFSVQSRASLASGSWTTLPNAPTLVGNTWQVTVPTTSSPQFYRIWH